MKPRLDMIIIVLLSSMIGLIIVKIVDTRLKDISINMPTVNLPTINITLPDDPTKKATVTLGATTSQSQSGGAAKEGNVKPDTKLPSELALPQACRDRNRFIQGRYESPQIGLKYTGKTPADSDKHNEMYAPYPREKPALTKLSEPLSKNTTRYYLDPKDMTPAQLEKFKHKSKLENMTVQDYTSWLNLFRAEPEKLAGFHRANLQILTHGGKLTENDLPRVKSEPPKADHEYMQLIKTGNVSNVTQPEYLGYLAYNYDVDVGSAPNRSLRHLDYVNADEPLKTWILTRDSKKI